MKKSMKAMKAMKAKKSGMKGMKKKAMKKSFSAKGKRAKSSVFRGTKNNTSGGLKKSDLRKNKSGKIVSKKASDAAKKRFVKNGLGKWTKAVNAARKSMGIKGFQAVGGKSAKGQALLKKARSLYRK